MRELSIEKQIYLCKYHDVDKSLSTTIGVSDNEAKLIIEKLKNNGLYEQYRKLDEYKYEEIINQEKKQKIPKYENATEKIMDKYGFDKTSLTYADMKNLLNGCNNARNQENISLTEIFRKIANARNVETYVINNNCKRALDKAYSNKKELFNKKYGKKPTLKEFVFKELWIEDKNVICDITENIQEDKAETVENKEENAQNINNEFIPKIDIEDGIVKVPIKTLLEISRRLGYLDRIIEEERRNKQ